MQIRFYKTQSGSRPVQKYIDSLSNDEAAKIVAAIDDIRIGGLEGSSLVFRHIDGKLWEIKFPIHRIFYIVLRGSEMVLLHAYKKQGQKAPKKEIKTALRRMKEEIGD